MEKLADLILIHTPTTEIWEDTLKLLFGYGFRWCGGGRDMFPFPERYSKRKPCVALHRKTGMEYCYMNWYLNPNQAQYIHFEKVVMEYEDILELNDVWGLEEELKCVR